MLVMWLALFSMFSVEFSWLCDFTGTEKRFMIIMLFLVWCMGFIQVQIGRVITEIKKIKESEVE